MHVIVYNAQINMVDYLFCIKYDEIARKVKDEKCITLCLSDGFYTEHPQCYHCPRHLLNSELFFKTNI